jgi:hypothetical protein
VFSPRIQIGVSTLLTSIKKNTIYHDSISFLTFLIAMNPKLKLIALKKANVIPIKSLIPL